MNLTNKQEQGLKIAVDRYKHNEKYTCISGYAGTGKSTLVRFIVSALNVPENKICYTTFTGKAAQVLLKKGNKNVYTLHKLLFTSLPKPDGSFIRIPVESIDYDIVIVDEVSMVPKTLWEQLMKYNAYVICLGDPGQLPPVSKNEDNHILDNPHIFLDEIMRQAEESEIIRLSMAIREGRIFDNFRGKEVIVLPKQEVNTGMYLWADQILCATNSARNEINQQMRQLLNHVSEIPEDGDKVICLRNYWDELANNEDPLVNGTIGFLKNCSSYSKTLPYVFGGQQIFYIQSDFISDSNATFKQLMMDSKLITNGEKTLDNKLEYRLFRSKGFKHYVPMEFTYGYAITCWKAQGSEWDKVLIFEEKFPFSKEDHIKYLYTAVTRGAEKVVLAR